jgi:hypothetical protein
VATVKTSIRRGRAFTHRYSTLHCCAHRSRIDWRRQFSAFSLYYIYNW